MPADAVVSPAPRDIWRTVLARDPDALPSHSPQWLDAMIHRTLWRDASRCYTASDGRRIILPMVRFGASGAAAIEASPRPGWGFGGITAEGGVTREDVALVATDLRDVTALRRSIRPNPTHADLWRAFAAGMTRVPRHVHVLDLRDGADSVWSRFHSSARRNVRIAEREGVTIERDDTGRLLPTFFRLLRMSRSRWAEQQHEPDWLAQLRGGLRDPLRKWERIASHLGSGCTILIAWYACQPAAGGIVLQGTNAHFTRSAMDRSVARSRAADALEWAAIQGACAAGSRWYHMGESPTEGVGEFKERFGARRVDYDEFVAERVPFSRVNAAARTAVKRVVGFEAEPDREIASDDPPSRAAEPPR